MFFERRVYYQFLRLNEGEDSPIGLEPWQVEDYSNLPFSELWSRLAALGIHWDRFSFSAHAQAFDTPEELTEDILQDHLETVVQDQIYLLIFELWKRLVPEKISLSIFCDSLDYHIDLFDTGELDHFESIQDIVASLQNVLDENVDQGGEPREVFASISAGCVHDLEGFLYDFIGEQIDEGSYTYAGELVEEFYLFIQDVSWFDFLRARLLALSSPQAADQMVRSLVQQLKAQPDLPLLLDMCAFMAHGGDPLLFMHMVHQAAKELKVEEEFHDLLHTCSDFLRLLDREDKQAEVEQLLASRVELQPEELLLPQDSDRQRLLHIMMAVNPTPKDRA